MTYPPLSADVQRFLDKDTTTAFLAAARRFVQLVESEGLSNADFFAQVHLSLSQLYASGHALDTIDLDYTDEERDFDRDELFVDKNKGQIGELGLACYYREVFDPTYDKNEEAGMGSLVDDFADIYRDLSIELTKLDMVHTNAAVVDALWQLKFSFHHHWGQHCVSTLRALHFLHYEGKPGL